MGEIDQAVVIILVMRDVRRDIDVIDPDIGALLHTDCVAVRSEDLGDGDVADNHVLHSLD